ncbi:hypothetical protein ACFC8N_42790 [Streptomyces sp. NPDC055966]|uniref:hypothetical protein n=1 Tax=Streptomyces sp. NPDC055966 TaxID=3345669 RepID=UPI0035E39C5D
MSARDRLLAYLQQTGLSTPRAEANLDAFANELAEKLRAWGQDGEKRLAGEPSPFYMWEDADRAADLIAPRPTNSAGPARPDEEPTP